jgi:hypothetical protein
MILKKLATNEALEAVIEPVNNKDFTTIKKSKNSFNKFDWDKHQKQEVFKIRLKSDETILGVICLIDHTDKATNAIEIDLLEVSSENVGLKKKFDNIAGCLIAIACTESFKRGHDGYVFLKPKTNLRKHYNSKYGFQYIPIISEERPEGLMVLDEDASRRLIQKFLE